MHRPYLLATVAALALTTLPFSAQAQFAPAGAGGPPSASIPGPGKADEPAENAPADPSYFAGPSPYAPQAPGVNAAHLPDMDSIDVSALPAMVPQQSANPAREDWATYGHDDNQTRYSPLDQITPENVSKLEVAFTYHTGSYPRPGQTNKWAAETTPIKVGDGLYMCSAQNDIIKLDPTTGKQIWRRDLNVKYESIPYTAACKGVTYFTSSQTPEGQPCHNRIIEGTLDMRLVEVDAATGEFCPTFGHDGQVNLMQGLGESVPGFVAMTVPPMVVNGVVVVNHEVLDGQRRWAPSGVVRGYDVESGKFVWAWDVKRPDDHSQPTGNNHYSRGTPNSWAALTGDNALGLVYVPTGNSAGDYFSGYRSPEENAVSTSIVALDVKTGSPRWVYQTTRKDVWDYDMGSQVTMMDMPTPDGQTVPAIIVPTKRGQTFVLDRRTGKSILPVEERPAPAGNVPGDSRAPTQPWSVGMPALRMPELQEKDMWGMSPLDQLYCRIKFRKAHYVGEFTPPSLDKPWIMYPGNNGGSDWGSMAYDPQTGILIANWNASPMYAQLITRRKADSLKLMPIDAVHYKPGAGASAEGNGPMEGTPYAITIAPFWDPFTRMLCHKPPYGMITAIDMKHGQKVLWQHPLGTARANGPWGLPTGLPWEIGTPNNGGSVITKGGLVFIGAATDNLIRAIDERTGKVLWSHVLPGGGQANPMTYEANGRQYVAIMAGGHHFMMTPISDQMVVFALPKGTN